MKREIILAGTAAPSVDNCQPWFFSIEGNVLTLNIDHKRADFFGDANYAAAYITFGSVIENMAIAARQFGFNSIIRYFPEGISNNQIAHIELVRDSQTSSPLYDFIHRRHTNRKPYTRKPLVPETMRLLSDLTGNFPGSHLFWAEDRADMGKLAVLIKRVERIIYEHKQLHTDLFRWIRWTNEEAEKTKDGLPLGALEISFPQKMALKFISSWNRIGFLNMFGASKLAAHYSYKLALNSSALGLIIMDNNKPEGYIEGGRLFQRLWLTATSHNLSLHPLGALIFFTSKYRLNGGEGFTVEQKETLREVNDSLCDLFPIKDDNSLIMLFRIGYAAPPTTTALRKPVSDVLIS